MTPTPIMYPGAVWPGGYPGLHGYPLGGYPGTSLPGYPPPQPACPPGYKMVWPRHDPHAPIRTDSPWGVPVAGGHLTCVPIGVAPNYWGGSISNLPHPAYVGQGVPGMMYPGNPFLVQAWEHGVVRTNLVLPSDQQAYDQAKYLLDTWPWKLTPNWTSGGVVRVTGPFQQRFRLGPAVHGLLGQWVITNGTWCHQGGPWTAGLPECVMGLDWKPTYPAYHPRAWAGPAGPVRRGG